MSPPLTIRDDLLPRCTVRVDWRKRPSGTGFFVAAGRVVTCAHVIQPEGPDTPVIPSDLTIRDREGRTLVVEEVAQRWPGDDPDLAILKVAAEPSSPCVLLDNQIRAGVEMHSYGYPVDHEGRPPPDEGGSPTSFVAEGRQGDRGWLKFKDGQVEPGMSGSPVLSMESGAVCAIVKRTRDKTRSLGGFAVPISSLLSRASWLTADNEAVHAADTTWVDLLSVDQARVWKAGRNGNVALPPAVHVIVSVSQDDRDEWRVSATIQPEGEAIEPIEVDLNTVRPAVARLFRSWTVQGRMSEGLQARTLGEVLFRAVFPKAIDQALRDLLESTDDRIVVSLRFEDTMELDLVNLPWEYLYQPDEGIESGRTLVTDPRIGFMRTLRDQLEDDEPPRGRDELSVLVVGVARDETDRDADDVARHLERLGADVPALHVERLETQTAVGLMAALRDGDYDVLHYVGCGQFEGDDRLAFDSATSAVAEYFPVETLQQILRGRRPRLVVLQACEDPSNAVPADFATFGAPLMRVGVPAAVIFQFPLKQELMAKFNEVFYRGLLDGRPVHMAVQDARTQFSLMPDQPRAWASAALFQRAPGELTLVGTPSSPAAYDRDHVRRHPRLLTYR